MPADFISLRAWTERLPVRLAHPLVGSKARRYANLSVRDR
jgi:hypothetical protein